MTAYAKFIFMRLNFVVVNSVAVNFILASAFKH